MISWDTMTPSSLSSTHHGHIHITLPRCQNWTTHPLHLLLPRHPSLPVRPLPLRRVSWNPTASPSKHFPIQHNSSRTGLHRRKHTRLSHNLVKRGRTAHLPSEFFGPCHSPDPSGIPHQQQQQHHVPNHKYLRKVLRNRRGASYSHRSRPSRLHKSTPRILLLLTIFPFVISFSSFSACITVRIY
jgi:hypothetical protein